MPISILDDPTVRIIKSRLWFGDTCESVARDYDVSVNAVRGIRAGTRWAAIPWPAQEGKPLLADGMPDWRKEKINAARREAAKDAAKTVKRKLKQS